MMRNFGVILLAGGAAIIGLGFFMRKDDGDKPADNTPPIDPTKATVAPLPKKNPGGLNVTTAVRIVTVNAIYS